MKRLSLILFSLVVGAVGISLVFSACSKAPSTASTPTPTATATGQQLYQANCASCHGADGAGGKKLGSATSADIRFAALNDLYSGNWTLVERSILYGTDEENEELDPTMPRWSGRLSDSDVNAIVQYLQTLK
jgi:mono/diheme cytochrome c family protein